MKNLLDLVLVVWSGECVVDLEADIDLLRVALFNEDEGGDRVHLDPIVLLDELGHEGVVGMARVQVEKRIALHLQAPLHKLHVLHSRTLTSEHLSSDWMQQLGNFSPQT